MHPRHEADHGGGCAPPHVEGEPERGARDDEVVVDGEDGVRGEPPDGPEPVVEAVDAVDIEAHDPAAGPVEDGPAQVLGRRARLAPHDVDGVDAGAGSVVGHGPPQERVAPPRVDHHREAAWRGARHGGGGVGAVAVERERERERERGGRRGEGDEAEDEAGRGESAGGGRVAGRRRVAAPGARDEAEAAAVAVPPVRRRLQLEQQLGHPGHELAPPARAAAAAEQSAARWRRRAGRRRGLPRLGTGWDGAATGSGLIGSPYAGTEQ